MDMNYFQKENLEVVCTKS